MSTSLRMVQTVTPEHLRTRSHSIPSRPQARDELKAWSYSCPICFISLSLSPSDGSTTEQGAVATWSFPLTNSFTQTFPMHFNRVVRCVRPGRRFTNSELLVA